jgi:hypothetical protein
MMISKRVGAVKIAQPFAVFSRLEQGGRFPTTPEGCRQSGNNPSANTHTPSLNFPQNGVVSMVDATLSSDLHFIENKI